MDSQDDEQSDHSDDLCNSLDASSFIQEQDSSGNVNVPCSFNHDIDSAGIECKCVDTKALSTVSFLSIDSVNSSKVSAALDNDLKNKCGDLVNVTECSSNAEYHLKISDGGIETLNKNFTASNKDSVHSRSNVSATDKIYVASEFTCQSDALPIETSINDKIPSTNYLETNISEGSHVSEENSEVSEFKKTDVQVRDIDNGQHSDIQSGSRMKTRRTRKRKSDDSASNTYGTNTTKKRQRAVTYLSQISPDQNGIKLKIKKSPGTTVRKYVKRKERRRNQRGKKNEEENESDDLNDKSNMEQSQWGSHLPVPVLIKVFSFVAHEDGCLPFLLRVSSVCRLWREAALAPCLWKNIDLSGTCIREKFKNEAKLAWLIENRLSLVEDLNIGGWKISSKWRLLQLMVEHCQKLRGINLTGWTGLNGEHLKYLVKNCQLLSRIDLSSVFRQGGPSRNSPVSMMAIRNLCETLGSRLTHLILADNIVAGINHIVSVLTASCPNMEVFDMSNLWNFTNILLNIEKLQAGCQKLRVLRASNSNFSLVQTTLKEQVASPGFPCLEELSVATDGSSLLQPFVDDESLERILKTSHKLRLLDVRGCTRITQSSLVRVPAWDLEHLFLSGCYITKTPASGLELVIQKWSHSLLELDIGWCCAPLPLDNALDALTEKGEESPLRILDLCGTNVSLEAVKTVLSRCSRLESLNLASCRALPRGIKRLYKCAEITELKSSLLQKPEEDTARSASSETPAEDMVAESNNLQDQPEGNLTDNNET